MKKNRIVLCSAFMTSLSLSYCASARSFRQVADSAAIRVASEKERDRVLALLLKGETLAPWRFAARSLDDKYFTNRTNGLIVLMKLAATDRSAVNPARALLEDVSVKGRYVDYFDRASMIWEYGNLGGPAGVSSVDQIAGTRCMHWAQETCRIGHLPPKAVSDCVDLLGSSDAGKRRAAIPILLAAAQLGGKSRKWAISLSFKQTSNTNIDKSGIWEILYEATTSKFIK